ncbi:MAG: rRNA pseudouridine synthase, partial [Myxococcales bacterium]|nr:rRNA pseudouridine synthase [Myxococcales bacterium]
MPQERLHKIIAQAGVSSRRAAEELIRAGRVRVNGRVVDELGAKADPDSDRIEVDGRRLAAEPLVYLVLHKPRNVVSTLSDPEGRPTVGDLVRSVPYRVFPVGRLDFATSGVLLMTNDGELANVLLHPRTKVPRTYVAKVTGDVSDTVLERWRTGIELEDGRTQPAEVTVEREESGGKHWMRATLREGRNQEVRRMAEATGLYVMRLVRLSFADIDCQDLRPGQWRALNVDELRKLKSAYGVPRRVRPAPELAAPTRAGRGGPGWRDAAPTHGRDAAPTRPRDADTARDAEPLRARDAERAHARDAERAR